MSIDFNPDGSSVLVAPGTITYYPKTGEGTYGTGVSITHVLGRSLTKELLSKFQGGVGKQMVEQGTTFNIWVSRAGGVVPKINDRITDATGTSWTVKKVEFLTENSRWRVTCLKEVS